MAVHQSNHLLEFSSVSGVVYVSVDHTQTITYKETFNRYVKVWVVIDDVLNSGQPTCFGPIQKEKEHDLENCTEDSLPVHFESLSSVDIPSEDSTNKLNSIDVKLLNDDEEVVKMAKQNALLDRKHKGLTDCKRKKGKNSRFSVIKSPAMKKCANKKGSLILTRDKRRENKACPRSGVADEENCEVKGLVTFKDVFCEYCSKSFKSQEEFYNHRKVSFIEHSCEICQKVFPFKAHLIVHDMGVHEDPVTATDSPQQLYDRDCSQLKSNGQSSSHNVYSSSQSSLACKVCGVYMSSLSIMKTHMMKHTGEKAYKCCVCSEEFSSISHFTHHMTTHRKSGKVQCKLCGIGFDSRSELSKHQLTHKYKCSLCGAIFPNKTSRAFHYKVSHKDDILKCPQCDKLYSSDSELKSHLKYHQNRSKTQCTICGRFVSRLSDHMLSHSHSPGETNECSIFVCDKCPKQFKQKLCFQRHLRTHSEDKLYACTHCPKRFARNGGLSRHMLTHTSEKPFVCPVCGKACTQMSNLRSHMQTHKDSGLLDCSLCGMAFFNRTAYQEHLNSAH